MGTWVAALATFAAVVVSLWLSSRRDSVSLRVRIGMRMIVGGGEPRINILSIEVTNLGERPVKLTGMGWEIGRTKRTKRSAHQVGQGDPRFARRVPLSLDHGESAELGFELEDDTDWFGRFLERVIEESLGASGFRVRALEAVVGAVLGPTLDRHLRSLRFWVSTSVGKFVSVKPEAAFVQRLRDEYQKRHSLDMAQAKPKVSGPY